jgi:Tfp pilus assembly protein PilX
MNIPLSPRVSRLRRARARRGNALFVVVMVTTLLTGVGLFAMRAASLSNLASGYNRQGTQTLYLSEFGTRSAAAELVGKEQHYFNKIVRGTTADGDDCRANRELLETLQGQSLTDQPPCAKLLANDIWMRASGAFSGASYVGTTARSLPGELGSPDLEGAFVVEMTDLAQVNAPLAGEDATAGRMKHMQVLLTTTAQIRPIIDLEAGEENTCQNSLSVTSSLQTLRARVTFGPVL